LPRSARDLEKEWTGMTIWPSTTIVLTVSPSLNADGAKAYSTRGQLFDGCVDVRRIVKRSTTPFCDAARVLPAEGIKPDTIFVMRHEGNTHDALRSTVGVKAKLAVRQDNGAPGFTRYKQPDFWTGPSPMRETDSTATLVPFELENAPQPVP
jgi:hypothetical protein